MLKEIKIYVEPEMFTKMVDFVKENFITTTELKYYFDLKTPFEWYVTDTSLTAMHTRLGAIFSFISDTKMLETYYADPEGTRKTRMNCIVGHSDFFDICKTVYGYHTKFDILEYNPSPVNICKDGHIRWATAYDANPTALIQLYMDELLRELL